MKKRYFILAIFIIITLFYLFYIIGTTKIRILFEDLEPLKHNLPVYYNGFKLGRTTNIYPSKDYKSTMIDIRITLKNLELPANTSAILRRKEKKDYIELEYPNAPYITKLKHNDIIKGHLGINFEHFLQDQAENGGLDEIKGNINNTIVSAGETFDALTDMLQLLTYMLKDAQPLVQDSINNLNITTKNLADSSFEIKRTLEKGYLDNSLSNIEKTSNNLVLTTNNTSVFTSTLDKQSSVLINCLLRNLNSMVNNLNAIILGIGETLKKRFGGIRLFLGKPIK